MKSMCLIVCAMVMIGAGCSMLPGLGIADNAATRAAFVAEVGPELAEEGVNMTAEELGALFDSGLVIAKSPAGAAIVGVVEGNASAKAKLQAALDKWLAKSKK